MLRITAPHFVAGIEPRKQAAPILMWMIKKGWDTPQIYQYCKFIGWQIIKIDEVKE